MDLRSPTLPLQITLCAYDVGVLGSLLALRHERIANLVGFGCATVAGLFGIGAGLLGPISGPGDGRAAFELRPSRIVTLAGRYELMKAVR
jgi:hypothetical protein